MEDMPDGTGIRVNRGYLLDGMRMDTQSFLERGGRCNSMSWLDVTIGAKTGAVVVPAVTSSGDLKITIE